jgi:hypothetical protein
MGDSTMSTEYLVNVVEETLTTYFIEADTPEEAEDKWRAGEYDLAKERGGEVLSVEVETAQ